MIMKKSSRGIDLTYLFKGGTSRNIKGDSLRRSLNSSTLCQGIQNHQDLPYDQYGKYDQILHFLLGFLRSSKLRDLYLNRL